MSLCYKFLQYASKCFLNLINFIYICHACKMRNVYVHYRRIYIYRTVTGSSTAGMLLYELWIVLILNCSFQQIFYFINISANVTMLWGRTGGSGLPNPGVQPPTPDTPRTPRQPPAILSSTPQLARASPWPHWALWWLAAGRLILF